MDERRSMLDAGRCRFSGCRQRARTGVAALTGDLAGRPVRRILITHCHPDHFGLGEWLAQADRRTHLDVPRRVHDGASLVRHGACNPNRPDGGLFPSARPSRRTVGRRSCSEGGRYRRVVGELPVAMRRILPGEVLRIGGDDWTGSRRLRSFAGTSVLPSFRRSGAHRRRHAAAAHLRRIRRRWPFEPETDAVGQYLDSIEKFRLARSWSTHRAAGTWRPVLRYCRARRCTAGASCGAPRTHRRRSAHQPATAADLAAALFKRALDSFQTRFAMGEVIAHLNHLWQDRSPSPPASAGRRDSLHQVLNQYRGSHRQ
jgi:hypothetical protein